MSVASKREQNVGQAARTWQDKFRLQGCKRTNYKPAPFAQPAVAAAPPGPVRFAAWRRQAGAATCGFAGAWSPTLRSAPAQARRAERTHVRRQRALGRRAIVAVAEAPARPAMAKASRRACRLAPADQAEKRTRRGMVVERTFSLAYLAAEHLPTLPGHVRKAERAAMHPARSWSKYFPAVYGAFRRHIGRVEHDDTLECRHADRSLPGLSAVKVQWRVRCARRRFRCHCASECQPGSSRSAPALRQALGTLTRTHASCHS